MRTYWLSFADATRSEGEQFLGVCVIEVDEDDALIAEEHLLPQSLPGAEWIIAAAQKAYRMGCNPGGAVLAYDISDADLPRFARTPRNQLLHRAELAALGHISEQ